MKQRPNQEKKQKHTLLKPLLWNLSGRRLANQSFPTGTLKEATLEDPTPKDARHINPKAPIEPSQNPETLNEGIIP